MMQPEVPTPLVQSTAVKAAGALTRGLWWTGSGTVATRIIRVALTVVMLQKLGFGDMGRWATAWSVMVVVEAFCGLGVNFAIVRMGDLSPATLRGLFSISTIWGFVLAGLLAAAAPLIGHFYREPALHALLLIAAFKLILIGPALVPLGLISRRLGFREITIAETIAGTVETLSSIALIVFGFGAAGLVWGTGARAFAFLLIVFYFQPVRPGFRFPLKEVIGAVSFGLHVVASNLLFQVYRNVDYFLIGLRLGVNPLGLYRVGFEIGMTPFETTTNVVNRVGYPVFAKVQKDARILRETFERTARSLLFLLLPIAAFITIEGRDLFAVVAAARWQAAVPLAQLLCWAGIVRGLVQLFAPLYQAGGRPRLAVYEAALTGTLLALGFTIAVFAAPAGRGPVWVACAWLTVYPIVLIWDLHWSRRYFGLTARGLIAALAPMLPGTLLMSLAMWLTARLIAPAFKTAPRLFLVGAMGAAIFFLYKSLVLDRRRSTSS